MIMNKIKRASMVFIIFAAFILTAKQFDKEDYTQIFENNSSVNPKKTKELVVAPVTHPEKITPQKDHRSTTLVANKADTKQAIFPSAPQSQVAQKNETKRKIKLINHMDDKKGLTYNHTTGKYKPKEFNLLVNNTENAHIERKKNFIKEAEQEIEIVNNTVYIDYDFKFIEYCGAYTRGGKRHVEIQVEEGADSLEIDFSWKNKDHIEVVKHGSIISAIDVTI